MKKSLASLLLILIASISLISNSWAHATLENSTPANNATTAITPQRISLIFDQNVRLIHSRLTNSNGEIIPLNLEDATTSGQEIQISLPTLAADTYKFEWGVYSEDGHPVNDTLRFTITGN